MDHGDWADVMVHQRRRVERVLVEQARMVLKQRGNVRRSKRRRQRQGHRRRHVLTANLHGAGSRAERQTAAPITPVVVVNETNDRRRLAGEIGIDRHVQRRFADRCDKALSLVEPTSGCPIAVKVTPELAVENSRARAGHQGIDGRPRCRLDQLAPERSRDRKGRKLGDRRQRAAGVGVEAGLRSWPAAGPPRWPWRGP